MWINQFETEVYGKRGMYFYEPLRTKAPRAGVRPYCCYLNTVIFHAYPYYVLPGKKSFVEYNRAETEWDLLGKRFMEGEGLNCLAPLVLHDGKVYELGGGRVIRRNGQWVMKWLGWKVHEDDRRWPYIQEAIERSKISMCE